MIGKPLARRFIPIPESERITGEWLCAITGTTGPGVFGAFFCQALIESRSIRHSECAHSE